MDESGAGDRHGFPATRWTVVACASGDSDDTLKALNDLCHLYWPPIYGFLRRCGHAPHDAEDLTQGFFVHLVNQGIMGRADREKGRLRTFLLADLKHFLANEQRAARRLKRGGGVAPLSLQAEEAEQSQAAHLVDPGITPELAYDRSWALTLLAHVLRELEADYQRLGKQALFAALKPFIVEGTEAAEYARVAAALGMAEGTVRVNVHRLRARYRELLLSQVADTVAGTAEQVQKELAHLLSALR